MALINCPECGHEVSDTAATCPHCGCAISQQQTEEKTKKKKSISKKKLIIIISSIIVALIIVAVGALLIKQHADNVEKERIQKESQKKQEREESYKSNLDLVSYSMLDGASKAEELGNLTHDVWSNAIFEEHDKKTDKYTIKNGKFVDDFNDAIANLQSSKSYQKKSEKIETNKELVNDLMKKMKNPPAKYSKASKVLEEYYDSYISLVELALSPTGNLNSFTESFNEADSEVLKNYNKMKVYLD